MNRPSSKELSQKIKKSRDAVLSSRISVINPVILAADALELDYLIEDIGAVLLKLLDEVKPDYYAGHRPPQRSYVDKIKDSELFAFQWKSRTLGSDIYFKFALHRERFWLVSLHKTRSTKGRKR